MDNCPVCGTPLQDTSLGRKWCSNHGIVEDSEEEIKSDGEHTSYIG